MQTSLPGNLWLSAYLNSDGGYYTATIYASNSQIRNYYSPAGVDNQKLFSNYWANPFYEYYFNLTFGSASFPYFDVILTDGNDEIVMPANMSTSQFPDLSVLIETSDGSKLYIPSSSGYPEGSVGGFVIE